MRHNIYNIANIFKVKHHLREVTWNRCDRPYGRLPELVYTEPTATDAIRRLKKVFDPYNILNPGKLF